MKHKNTVLILAPNDAEGVMIDRLAEKMGLARILSKQLHGASIDKGRDYVRDIMNGKYSRVVIFEMPGVKAEEKLRGLGINVDIIDHHHYTGLDRAHDKNGLVLPSSLEQFLRLFDVTDEKIRLIGFDPRLVRGIGIQDRGFVWALKDEGYSESEIKKVMIFHDSLIAHLQNPKTEKKKQRLALASWQRRKKWREFFIVTTRADIQLRPRLSRIVAMKIGKPTSLIIVEYFRGLIYVQESPYALHLFDRFGGFTFGLDHSWGYRNVQGHKKVTLCDVQKEISAIR